MAGSQAADKFQARTGWAAGVLLILLWMISPVLGAQHIEGYTANLKSAAIAANRGDPMGSDLLYPAVVEFIAFTRPGLVALLRLSDPLFARSGDLDFRVLMIASLALLLWASVAIAGRFGGVRPWQSLLAILLVPGVTEAAFFFNDNLPSTALAVAAMALVALRGGALAYVGSGCLLGAAILFRLDAILLAPAVAGLIWMRHGQIRPLAGALFLSAIGFLAVTALAAVTLKATPLDALIVGGRFFPGVFGYTREMAFLLFFGAAGGLLLAIGAVASVRWSEGRADRLRWLLVFVLVPAAIALVGLRISTEIRYIYPLLTPFIALHGGRGVAALVKGVKGPRAWMSRAAIGALAILAIAPPFPAAVWDGPRSPLGRVWMPLLWWRWENAVARNLARVDRLVAAAGEVPRTLLISTHFNDDAFLRQRFLAEGYRVLAPEQLFGCSGFSVYGNGRNLVAHIRGENQYSQVPGTQAEVRALLLDQSLSCRALGGFDRAFLTAYGEDIRGDFADRFSPEVYGPLFGRVGAKGPASTTFGTRSLLSPAPWRPATAGADVPQFQRLGGLQAYPLSPADLRSLHLSAKAFANKPGPAERITFEDFRKAYAPRCINPSRARLSDIPLCLTGR